MWKTYLPSRRQGWVGLVAGLLVLFVSGCNEPEMELPLQDSVHTYRRAWEYRYGDSPRQKDGSLAFAQPGHDDGQWRPTRLTGSPPGRNGERVLWLRTRLEGPLLFDPILYSRSVDFLYEAYLDGKLIGHLGEIPPRAQPYIGGSTSMFLRLPRDYAGRTLSIRLYSQYSVIGIMSPLLLSGRTELLVHFMRIDLAKPLVGFMLISSSIVGLLAYFIRRREVAFLYFFGFSLSTGIFVCIARNSARCFFLGLPQVWWAAELISLCVAGIFLCGFFEGVFGAGPFRMTARFKWLLLGFFGLSFVAVSLGVVPAFTLLRPLQILLVLAILYLSVYCFVTAWMGNIDARIFGAGFFMALMPVLYDLLTELRILPGKIDSPTYGALLMGTTLIIVLTRRFRSLNRQSELLAAAARMARGDLSSPIKVAQGSELSSLAEALENMRRDLSAQFQTLKDYNREIDALNEELRRKIDQSSQRVLDLALTREDLRTFRKAHYETGALLGERYRVVRLLGQGATGSVYEVERTSDGRHLAAKVLAPRADKLAMVRFVREAQILARLKHPNLIGIVDVDVTDTGVLYLVMELVTGTSLKLCQARYGERGFALPVLRQMAAGLYAIHAAGIVHRDLGPQKQRRGDQKTGPQGTRGKFL